MAGDGRIDENRVRTARCLNCGEIARLIPERMRRDEGSWVLTIFKCKTCRLCEINLNGLRSAGDEPIVIECTFTTKEDLRREALVAKNAAIEIRTEEQSCRFKCGASALLSVRRLVADAMRLGSRKDEQRDILIGMDTRGTGSMDQALLDELSFSLIIRDPSGLSRVAPKNTRLFSLNYDDIGDFNESGAIHTFGTILN
jgi:hypothetical protein